MTVARPSARTMPPPTVQAATDDSWDQAAAADRCATLFHTRAWSAAVARTTGLRSCPMRFTFDDGHEAVLPCTDMGGRFGRLLRDVRSVASGYGGPISATRLDTAQLDFLWAAAIRYLGPGARLQIRANPLGEALRPPPRSVAPWQVSVIADFTHVLDLSAGFDALWERSFDKRARNQYRKGVKDGVTFERGASATSVGEYYALHEQTARGWAAHERRSHGYFARLFQDAEHIELWLAREAGGAAIGGVITLAWGRAVHIWATARDAEWTTLRPMDVLYTEVIRDACGRGFDLVDMGSSLGLPSVQAFKEQFGPKRVDYPVYTLSSLPWRVAQLARSRLRAKPS